MPKQNIVQKYNDYMKFRPLLKNLPHLPPLHEPDTQSESESQDIPIPNAQK